MAKKLYVFGIGGTGSRVIKAFAMLLASGFKLPPQFDTVIPIIIDPDTSNGDLNRTKDILRLYQEIRNQIDQPDDFFSQEIKTINELANASSTINPELFQFKLENTDTKTFGEYIGYDSLNDDSKISKDDKSFIKLLYSDSNLKSDLNVGFKGNPNMGSIVLNQFTNSENFRKFGQTFNEGDGIFIINSIFGGTGAAGFPLLLKNLRGNKNLPNFARISSANIGAITYLPYFALSKKEEIDSESFEEKSKIAIDYYNRTIINQKQIDSIYFIGNRGNTKHIEYSVGGKNQKNDAHFLELVGALAILDYCENIENQNESSVIKEFGIQRDTNNITFYDLDIKNKKDIALPLTKFKIFTTYLEKGLPKALNISRWTMSNIKGVKNSRQSVLDSNYFGSTQYKNQILTFKSHFEDWLKEMGENKPAFNPFEKVNNGNILELINGVKPRGPKSFKVLDVENCRLIDNYNKITTNKKHTALIKLFGNSIQNILNKSDLLKQIS